MPDLSVENGKNFEDKKPFSQGALVQFSGISSVHPGQLKTPLQNIVG